MEKKIKRLLSSVLLMSFLVSLLAGQKIEVHAADVDAELVMEKIQALQELDFSDPDQDLSEVREPVVYARHLYSKLEDPSVIPEDMVRILEEAEGKVLNLWIQELMPLDSFMDSGMMWTVDEQYSALTEELGETEAAELVPNYQAVDEFYQTVVPQLEEKKRTDYAAAMSVQEQNDQMQVLDLRDQPEAEAARNAYESLTDDQKAYVTNYPLLKKAETQNAEWEGSEVPDFAPKNIVYSGSRSSSYGVGTPWLSADQWGEVASDMQGYFPDSQSTMVWIIGSLKDDGVHLEFDRPDWLTEEWLAEKPYRSLDNIAFGEPDVEGHASHEDYFDYFDEKGIRVYLQVEPGFSDVKTLMDILMEEYGSHPCIAGFGVDVEWYWGVEEDSGLPVTDALAEDWDTHLKEWNPDYRLFLKHYNADYLPPTYRSDILFVDDSQSFGSMNGDALGQYDENLDDVLGFIPEFREFAKTFAGNEVLYQIGYGPDRMWYYTLDEPVIQSLGERLAEVTDQNCGIIWVDFSLKDPMTFPELMSREEQLDALKELIGYFRNADSDMVGKRFAAGEATYTDAMFVKRINQLVDELSEEDRTSLRSSFVTEEEKEALAGYEDVQAKAIDIRIAALPDPLREKDEPIVQEIRNDYDRLTEAQKAQVTRSIPDAQPSSAGSLAIGWGILSAAVIVLLCLGIRKRKA